MLIGLFRIDVSVLVLQRVKRQIPIETDRVIVFALIRVAAEFVGFSYVLGMVAGYDELRRGLENRLERPAGVVAGRPAVLAEEQSSAFVFLVPVLQYPCKPNTEYVKRTRLSCDIQPILTIHAELFVYRFEIASDRVDHLAVGQREIVCLVEAPVAEQSSGPILQEQP